MTAGRFANAQALALRQIADKGEVATLTTYAQGAPADATKPWEPAAPTATSVSVSAVFLGIKESRFGSTLNSDGDSLLKLTDLYVLVAASGLTVTPTANSTRITRADGTSYEVVMVEPLNPNEDVIMFEMVARR